MLTFQELHLAKLGYVLTKDLFTKEEHAYAERTIGQLYNCRPVDTIFSPSRVERLQQMAESNDLRGLMKLGKESSLTSDKP